MGLLYDLARMTTLTTGNGASLVLDTAVPTFLSFDDAGVPDGGGVSYAIVDGLHRETGRGLYTTSSKTLTRAVESSTAAGARITLSGSAVVFITALDKDFREWNDNHDANGYNLLMDTGTGIKDDSGNSQLLFTKTASAVNYFGMTNAATGNSPALAALGSDTNLDLILNPKGTGKLKKGTTPILLASGVETLTGGFKHTPYNAGTKSSGTFTPVYSDGGEQYCVNGGAFTLGVPADDCMILLQVTNNGSAGAITTSAYTRVVGAFTTVNGDDFLCFIYRINGFTSLHIFPLQ